MISVGVRINFRAVTMASPGEALIKVVTGVFMFETFRCAHAWLPSVLGAEVQDLLSGGTACLTLLV